VSRLWIAALVACSATARADGVVIEGGSPRDIGRAGTGTVGDDGGGALLVNPAAMARRDTKRAQLGVSVIDDAIDWQPAEPNTPRARDQAASDILPLAAAEGSVCGWILGLGAMTSAAASRTLASPSDLPANQLANRFEYRYGGIAGSLRRDTVALGAARRIGEWLAVGASLAGSRVSVSETRAVWAGFAGREQIGDPEHDVDVALSADAPFSPSAVAGVLIAPPDTRLELAASIAWAAIARTSGSVTAAGASSAVSASVLSPTAKLEVRQPITVRAGARWVGSRLIGEIDGDLWIMPAAAEAGHWQLGSLRIIDATGVYNDLEDLPSRLSMQTKGAVRASLDAQLFAGFLWATAGYAYTTAGTADDRLSPTFGDLGGHTLGLGLEASAGSFTITVGWSRTWSTRHTVDATAWKLDNPFLAGDGPVPLGTYDGSRDLVGVSVEGELDAPP